VIVPALAEEIAEAIMRNLEDRKGILDGLDDDVIESIHEDLAEVVRDQLDGALR
jgi:hypothetical protein